MLQKKKKKAIKKPAIRRNIRFPRGSQNETDFLILLDESGSMQLCKEETISNFNEQVQAVKKAARGQKVKVSLATFNTPGHGRTVLWREPVEKIQPLTDGDYLPDGSTAMYDAIVEHLDKLSKELGEPRKPPVRTTSKPNPCAMVVIVSDGYENASWASAADVAERIQALQNTNRWTFTYMGANQDLSKLRKTLRIPQGNTLDYLASKQGTRSGGQMMAQAMSSYVSARSMGATGSSNLFSPKDSITKVRDTAESMAGKKLKKQKKGD